MMNSKKTNVNACNYRMESSMIINIKIKHAQFIENQNNTFL